MNRIYATHQRFYPNQIKVLASLTLMVFAGCGGLLGDIEQTKYASTVEMVTTEGAPAFDVIPVPISSEVPLKLSVKDQFSNPLVNDKLVITKVEGQDGIDFPPSVFTDEKGIASITIKTTIKEEKIKLRAQSLRSKTTMDLNIETFKPFVRQHEQSMLRECAGQIEFVGVLGLVVENAKKQPMANVDIKLTIENGRFSGKDYQIPLELKSNEWGMIVVNISSEYHGNLYSDYVKVDALVPALKDERAFTISKRVTKNLYLNAVSLVEQTQTSSSNQTEKRSFVVQSLASCDQPLANFSLKVEKKILQGNSSCTVRFVGEGGWSNAGALKTDSKGYATYTQDVVFKGKDGNGKDIRQGMEFLFSAQGVTPLQFHIKPIGCP